MLPFQPYSPMQRLHSEREGVRKIPAKLARQPWSKMDRHSKAPEAEPDMSVQTQPYMQNPM